ncbi:MAG: hypothetical protein Tsb0020_28030 [Haliangiales bacterium]
MEASPLGHWRRARGALFCVAALVSIVGLLAACARGPGSGGVPPASDSVERLIHTLRSDQPEDAYALLSEDIRAQIGFEEFAAKWRATQRERQARADRIAAELEARPAPQERARIATPSGGSAYLVREGDKWRIESPLLSSAYASQPQDAVRYFSRALAARDYEALLRVLTERRRAVLSRTVSDLQVSLSEHLASGIDTVERVSDERAILRWDDGDTHYELVLHRESDQWRIDELHLRRITPGD